MAPGYDLTVLGSTDTHGYVYNWDYYRDAEYDDPAGNDVGLAKLATLINQVRAERAGRPTLVLDAGDTIQGTPLTTYYAKQEPITSTGRIHPIAHAMNTIGYDAVALGNHEFNYGLPLLAQWIGQLDFPALAANAVDPDTGEPAYQPYLIKRITVDPDEPDLAVGILGLTNPGTAIWDREVVEGRLRFEDMVTSARRWVPVIRAEGAHVVLVSAHGGDSGASSYGPELPNENPTAFIAEEVPGIDAILFGHAHAEVAQRFVTNRATGAPVLLCEPSYWGQRLARMDLSLTRDGTGWRVGSARSALLNSNTAAEDPAVLAAVRGQHARTVGYVNQVVATSVVELSAAESRYRDTPILSYVNAVQTEAIRTALAGTAHGDLPVLSVTPPFRRGAVFPAGDVRIMDVAGLYIFDNTLDAVLLDGAEVRAHLERSARYFRTVPPGEPVDPDRISDPRVPDHNYDIMSGVDYDIDISRPAGDRITRLTHAGTDAPVEPADRFVVAVNSYRRAGGGNFPQVVRPAIHHDQREVRQLLIDWAHRHGKIDPADFYRPNWRLVRAGVPVF
nr:5'-nucleotidase C-terminal domain-containing protein [Micromonospora sp. DSM 115978]